MSWYQVFPDIGSYGTQYWSRYRLWPDIVTSWHDIDHQIPDIGINIGISIGCPDIAGGMYRIPISGSISGQYRVSRFQQVNICRWRVQFRVQHQVSRYRVKWPRYYNQYRVWYQVLLNHDGPGWCLALTLVITCSLHHDNALRLIVLHQLLFWQIRCCDRGKRHQFNPTHSGWLWGHVHTGHWLTLHTSAAATLASSMTSRWSKARLHRILSSAKRI